MNYDAIMDHHGPLSDIAKRTRDARPASTRLIHISDRRLAFGISKRDYFKLLKMFEAVKALSQFAVAVGCSCI
jgi:hypothetical protein